MKWKVGLHRGSEGSGFPKLGVPFEAIIRILALGGVCWEPLILGNYQI